MSGSKVEVTFSPERHEYTVNGRPAYTVTKTIQAAGLVDFGAINPQVLELARQIGTEVHKATAYLDKGTLEEYDQRLLGYIKAWGLYTREHEIQFVEIEQPVGSALHNFAGTPDRIAVRKGKLGIPDIKTGVGSFTTRLQLAAYALAYEEMHRAKIHWREAVYLNPNGTYRVEQYKDHAKNKTEFLGCLAVAKLKHEYGIVPLQATF